MKELPVAYAMLRLSDDEWVLIDRDPAELYTHWHRTPMTVKAWGLDRGPRTCFDFPEKLGARETAHSAGGRDNSREPAAWNSSLRRGGHHKRQEHR